jgi:hypothetical protein
VDMLQHVERVFEAAGVLPRGPALRLVAGHPLALTPSAVGAHAAGHVGGVRAVLQVVPARNRRAASSASRHESSVRVSPHTWLGVSRRSRTAARNDWPARSASKNCRRSSTGSLFVPRLGHVPFPRRDANVGTRCSRIRYSSAPAYRAQQASSPG